MLTPELSIIIVNYRTVDVLKRCLQSLYQQEAVSFEVIVVDNDSGEQEHAQLHAILHPSLHIIVNPSNLGFGRANNIGVKHARAPILLILNPDTYLQSQRLLRQYIDAFKAQDYALLVPRLSESEKNKTVLPRTEYPSQAYCRHTDFSALSGQFAWVLGACMMIEKADYVRIGGFDEDYFMYGEDVDFCWRVRQHLGAIGVEQTLTVNHIGSVSEKTTIPLQKWLKKRAGQYLFFQKRYHPQDVRRILLRQRLSACLKLCKNALLNILLDVSEPRIEEDARATATLMTSAEILKRQ